MWNFLTDKVLTLLQGDFDQIEGRVIAWGNLRTGSLGLMTAMVVLLRPAHRAPLWIDELIKHFNSPGVGELRLLPLQPRPSRWRSR